MTTAGLMSGPELAEYLGLSASFVYAHSSQAPASEKDPIPFARLGGSVRFRKVEVDAWLDRQFVSGNFRERSGI